MNFIKIKKILPHLAVLLSINIVLAFILGDINFPTFQLNFKGFSDFLAFMGYTNLALYLAINLMYITLVCCSKFSENGNFNGSKIMIALLLGSIVLFGLIVNTTYSPITVKGKYEMYNYILANNINSKRICKVNAESLAFVNINKLYDTPTLCKEEIISLFLKDDKLIKEYKKSIFDNNDFMASIMNINTKCESFTGCDNFRPEYEYVPIIKFLSLELSKEEWIEFNRKLLEEFKNVGVSEKEKYDYSSSKAIKQYKVFVKDPVTLKENQIGYIDDDKEVITIKGYHFISMTGALVPIKEDLINSFK